MTRALAFILFLSSGFGGCAALTPDQTVALSNAAVVVVTAILQAAKQ